MFRNTTAYVFSCFALFSAPVCQAEELPASDLDKSNAINLAEFVSISINQGFDKLIHNQTSEAEKLSYQVIKDRYIPKLTISSTIGREQNDSYSSVYLDNNRTGIDTTIELQWLLPTGATVSLQHQNQIGELAGLTSLGVPEITQHNQTNSITIEQPVIGGLWNNLNALPEKKAQLTWQLYEAKGALISLQTQNKAIEDFIHIQFLHDKIKLLKESLALAEFRTNAIKERFTLGQVVKAELLNAQLELHQRQTLVTKAMDDLAIKQRQLASQINALPNLALEPLESLNSLMNCSSNEPNKGNLTTHPDLRISELTTKINKISLDERQFDHWPQVSLFYSAQQTNYEIQTNTSEQSWGIKASYKPLNLETKAQQSAYKANWQRAHFQQLEKQEALNSNRKNLTKQNMMLRQQLLLAEEGLILANEAFQHAELRHEHGVDSVLATKLAQNEWLNLRLAAKEALRDLLINQNQLLYAYGTAANPHLCH